MLTSAEKNVYNTSAESNETNETNEPDEPIHINTSINPPDIEEKTALDLITSSISCCITTGDTVMSREVTEAARKYYLSIVNNTEMSIDEKRHKIYQDLVIGTKISLTNNTNYALSNISDERIPLSLSYRIGLNNDIISNVTGEILVVGHYKENDIYITNNHVSRIHCFIFQINNKLIILDGWSKCGTQTINIASNTEYIRQDIQKQNKNNNNNENDEKEWKSTNENNIQFQLVSSLPKQRNILQYNINDTIHIKLGSSHWGTNIIINPKKCIVCTEKARIIRLKCGHQILCNQCYTKIKQNTYRSTCPICRKPFHFNINKGNNMPNISAGVHTYAAFESDQ